MEIVQEMEKRKVIFGQIEAKIQEHQKEITELTDELKRIQGEYRLLVQMGVDQGIVDEQGNLIENKEE